MADTLNQLAAASVPAEIADFGLPTHTAVGSATGATTATFAAQTAPNRQWHLVSFVVSFAATITSACTITVKDGSTVIWQEEVPTATNPLPIARDFSRRPLRGSTGAALTVNVSSPGSITATISASAFLAKTP